MKLHSYFRSSCAYRVRIALSLKGMTYESVAVHLRRGEQRSPGNLARNPQGLVPTLEDGEVVIGQSLAILEYLEEIHPETPLLPETPAARARVRQLALAIACDIQPLQNLSVLDRLTRDFGLDERDRLRWTRGVIEDGLRAVEAMLERGSDSESDSESESDSDSDCDGARCCFGDQPSLADVCLVPQVYNARRFACDLGDCPRIEAIYGHCTALEAFREAAPENQPDAE